MLALMKTAPPEHPRVCGENLDLVVGACFAVGTSPRMRGKLFGLRSLG